MNTITNETVSKSTTASSGTLAEQATWRGRSFARRVARAASSLALVGLLLALLAPSQLACGSGSAQTCSSSDEKSCTDTFNACVQKAAAAADRAACQTCVDNYCSCYSACGNTCDRPTLARQCQ